MLGFLGADVSVRHEHMTAVPSIAMAVGSRMRENQDNIGVTL